MKHQEKGRGDIIIYQWYLWMVSGLAGQQTSVHLYIMLPDIKSGKEV